MYNLNGSTMNGPPILSVVDGVSSAGLTPGICTTTPRTPEILNSVIAMTNPLEYSFPSTTTGIVVQPKQSQVRSMWFSCLSRCFGCSLSCISIMIAVDGLLLAHIQHVCLLCRHEILGYDYFIIIIM